MTASQCASFNAVERAGGCGCDVRLDVDHQFVAADVVDFCGTRRSRRCGFIDNAGVRDQDECAAGRSHERGDFAADIVSAVRETSTFTFMPCCGAGPVYPENE